MGSIQAAGSYDLQYRKHDSMDISSLNQDDSDGFNFFEINNINSEQKSTPTGTQENVLLLAWLLVLLRTQESGQVSFSWRYKCLVDDFEHELAENRLMTSEIVGGLQDSVDRVAEAIAQYIITVAAGEHVDSSRPVSLLLRTSAVSKSSEENKDEVSK
jgi:hypothetical protein